MWLKWNPYCLSGPQVSLYAHLCLSAELWQHCGWVIVWWTDEWQSAWQSYGSSQPHWPLSSYAGTLWCYDVKRTSWTSLSVLIPIITLYAPSRSSRFNAAQLSNASQFKLSLDRRCRGRPISPPCPRWDCLCVAMGRGWMWCLGNTGSLSALTPKVSMQGRLMTYLCYTVHLH